MLTATAFIGGLNLPFGMALIGSDLYVATVIDRRGALLVADDVGNAVWRVSPLKR